MKPSNIDMAKFWVILGASLALVSLFVGQQGSAAKTDRQHNQITNGNSLNQEKALDEICAKGMKELAEEGRIRAAYYELVNLFSADNDLSSMVKESQGEFDRLVEQGLTQKDLKNHHNRVCSILQMVKDILPKVE